MALRAKLVGLLGDAYAEPLPSMPDAELVHALAQHLDFEPVEKQALLESPTLLLRAQALLQLLEMNQLAARYNLDKGVRS